MLQNCLTGEARNIPLRLKMKTEKKKKKKTTNLYDFGDL